MQTGWNYKAYYGDKTVYYLDDFVTLDIETSHNDNIAWIVSIQLYFQGVYTLLRTPLEFIQYYQKLINDFSLDNQHRLVTIIHNASYDLSYLIPYIQLYLPEKEDRNGIYASEHKIKMYRQGGLEFLDTLSISGGQSLDTWSKNLNTEHRKEVGLYDYTKVLYQDSILNDQEKLYDMNDVLTLYDCFMKQLEIEEDATSSIPRTSTGYVRRDFRRECRKDKYFRQDYFVKNKMTLDVYKLAVKAFAGGYTHNNRFYADKIIRGHIKHRDFRSMYPTEIRCYPMPWGKAETVYDITKGRYKALNIPEPTIEEILGMMPDYSTITELYITKATLKDKKISMPFMQFSKLYNDESVTCRCIKDNGRVLYFKGGASICLDNYTLKIIQEQYNIEYHVLKCIRMKNKPLPKPIKETVDKFFKLKTDLKYKAKEAENKYGEFSNEAIEARNELMRMKGRLNGIYGMMVTNCIQAEYDIDYAQDEIENVFIKEEKITDQQKQEAIDKYYKSRNSFLYYIAGTFVTALARYELYEYIKVIGYDKVLYCDTDSIFYLSDDSTEKAINDLQAEKAKHAEYIIDEKGNRIYYDVFEEENDITAFKGLHSKCYAYIDCNNDFIATIAGVPSRTLIGMKDGKPVYLTREEELSGISAKQKMKGDVKVDNEKALKNVKDGFIFYVNTGTTCDYSTMCKPCEMIIDGHKIHTASGAIIKKLDSKEIKDTERPDEELIEYEII